MSARLARPHILDPHGAPDLCSRCEARSVSVCNAIADTDLGRLAAIAVITEVGPGQCFIEEGEPANSFFNITAGTAKLFKLLPDGRRQITGFVGAGHFLAVLHWGAAPDEVVRAHEIFGQEIIPVLRQASI